MAQDGYRDIVEKALWVYIFKTFPEMEEKSIGVAWGRERQCIDLSIFQSV